MGPDIGTLVTDRVIHERARLLILTYLAGSSERAVAFSTIKDALDFTSGNLSIQLKTLAEAGYITITKQFRDNRPLTQVSITSTGASALKKYVGQMETLIKRLRG